MDKGEKYQCRIKNITGGGSGRRLGVNIEITNVEEFDDALSTRMKPAVESLPLHLHGSQVGDLFRSLIHTCELADANPFDYLTELQRHASELVENPSAWMPWNYTGQNH